MCRSPQKNIAYDFVHASLACLVRLTEMACKMGLSKWSYCCSSGICCLQDLFKTALRIFCIFHRAFSSTVFLSLKRCNHTVGLTLLKQERILFYWRDPISIRSITCQYQSMSHPRRYIKTISVYNLSRLYTTKDNRSHEKKWSHTKKSLEKMLPSRNYYGCRLRRWYRASDKYTHPSRIPAT